MEKKTETEETVTPRSLETVRLLIRPFQEEDADAFFACCQNPNLGNNAGWAPHKTIEESRKILQDVFIGQENIWAMILKDAQQLIGSIGIVPTRNGRIHRSVCWGTGLTKHIGAKDI